MSRAGKFIPGGGGGASKARRSGPIRAPEPGTSVSGGGAPSPGDAPKKKLLAKGSLRAPVAKKQRLPIAIMSAFVCCLLVSVAWYIFAYLPLKRSAEMARANAAQAQSALAAEKIEEEKKHEEEIRMANAASGVVIVDSTPSGAKVTIGDVSKTTPARVDNLISGPCTVTIQHDGYEDFKTAINVDAKTPVDMGTVALVPQTGSLALSSSQSDVSYTLTGPAGYSHDGTLPDKIEKLPVGDYSLTATQREWQLPPLAVTVRDHDSLSRDIKFPYAKVTITSSPAGATVREGRSVLGQTPLTLPPVRPRDFHLTVDLPPNTLQHLDFTVGNSANVVKAVELKTDKDFIAACGLPLVWIPEGGFWAAKYDFPQSDFEKVAGYNPSYFRGANRPVETISWESAQAFLVKLNDYERKAGKLPPGYHYALPRESQWEMLNADANLDLAATSRVSRLSSTQDVGYSAPNKYGLYDTLGNVWEWCLDDFDDKGNHTLRGGTWLSSPDDFAGPAARQGGPPKYADKLVGFRAVLVPNA